MVHLVGQEVEDAFQVILVAAEQNGVRLVLAKPIKRGVVLNLVKVAELCVGVANDLANADRIAELGCNLLNCWCEVLAVHAGERVDFD